MTTSKQRYVVLDLDNTLIYARVVQQVNNLAKNEFAFRVLPNRSIYRTIIRDHLKTFVDTMIERGYKLIVWSAGSEYYVKCIVQAIFDLNELSYVLTYNHLTDKRKILSTLHNYLPGIDMRYVRLLDDNRIHEPGQESNFVYIDPFTGAQDNALLQAIDDIEKSFK